MTEQEDNKRPNASNILKEQVEKKADRRRWAKTQKSSDVWFGFGMFGLIGWAVAIPTIIGITFGIWLDHTWPVGRISWTVSLLFVGIILGCMNAWHWVNRERQLESRSDFNSENKEK